MPVQHVMRLLVLIAIFWGGHGVHAADRINIGMASNTDSERSGVYVWVQAFTREMNAAGYETQVYPNSSLGREDERSIQVSLGLLEMNFCAEHEVAMYAPLFKGISLSFLIGSYAEFDRFLHETQFLEEVNSVAASVGLRVVDVAFLGGMGGIFNTRKPLYSLADMEGLRMRAMGKTDLTVINSWGVRGTQVAWEEVAQALQTGIADGYLNPPLVPIMFGHAGQIKYFAKINTAPSYRTLVVSDKWYKSLSPADRAVFEKAVYVARRANRQWSAAMELKEASILKRAGITITEFPAKERARLVAQTRAVYDQILDPKLLPRVMEFVREVEREE